MTMNLDQIEDMLMSFRSDDPIERVDGLKALAEFLFDQQNERARRVTYAEKND